MSRFASKRTRRLKKSSRHQPAAETTPIDCDSAVVQKRLQRIEQNYFEAEKVLDDLENRLPDQENQQALVEELRDRLARKPR